MIDKSDNQKWIERQGDCCIEGCFGRPVHADNLDNVFCEECVEQNIEEEPENWEDE